MLVIRGVDIRAFPSFGVNSRQKRGKCTARSVVTSALQEQGPAYLGLDFGTSGARAVCISGQRNVLHDAKVPYHRDKLSWPLTWERALHELLEQLPLEWRQRTAAIAVAGTTTTSLLVDRRDGSVLADPILYNEPQGQHVVSSAEAIVPAGHSAAASVSSLCKLLSWHQRGVWQQAEERGCEAGLLHHADWMASLLHGSFTCTDWHNAARLGYNAASQAYPPCLLAQDFARVVPQRVYEPGSPVAAVTPAISQQWGFPPSCLICAGTTDSVAAFLAANVEKAGESVSSLGSTLAVDLLSTTPIDAARYGICSYRWQNNWIVDGGSNTGGAVLQQFFNSEQLSLLSEQIDPQTSSGLQYYPLLGQGQRFPINDPNLQPHVSPRPEDDSLFLHGLLEGIARIECEAYNLLKQLGATPVTKVHTAGGGSTSKVWTTIREGMLGVSVVASEQAEAAYGAALLALSSFDQNGS
ncbi:hypothetical protein WJX79_006379 [Trebouxia sp. C0005]